jgi:hypothetical protein
MIVSLEELVIFVAFGVNVSDNVQNVFAGKFVQQSFGHR